MSPACTENQELLIECRGIPRPEDAELLAHLGLCVECASFAQRAAATARGLSLLAREPVPAALEGLVVAALEAGYRQDRASSALRGLSRLPAPTELAGRALDARISLADQAALANPNADPNANSNERAEESPSASRAPDVLDRLVDEELRDPVAAMTRRFAGRLERQRAPGALRELVRGSSSSVLRPPGARRALLAAAVLALLFVGGGVWILDRGTILRDGFRERAARGDLDRGFEVRYETTLDAMDPMARSLLAGLSGGVVDAGGQPKRL